MEMAAAALHVDTEERSSGKIPLGFALLLVTMRFHQSLYMVSCLLSTCNGFKRV
ncbi:hypothetical protein TRIUR3_23769 [Triticum urartu]|uniref:Uncharacterized protein n=1 Tax=Triticum urartu TaxID=4572 RepID=M7YHZ8_TRIUA|nr:hypothetical protein TRIUR3_23769 [Triticum urartu]